MKNILLLFSLLLLFGCGKSDSTTYPITEKVWVAKETLHVPDNLGFYTSQLGYYYQFKSDGSYKAGNGTNTTNAKWYWLEEGVKFKLDYESQASYNDVFTVISMSDTLLHVKKRIEGEPENTGNYWELKYRPVFTSCDDALKAMDGKKLFSGNLNSILYGTHFDSTMTEGQAILTTDFIHKMDIAIASDVLDTLLHYTYTCTEVSWDVGNIPVIEIFDTDGKKVTTQPGGIRPGGIELKFGAATFLFPL